jgi:HAE1 family hydrophobic/amphiphilic exporter-1
MDIASTGGGRATVEYEFPRGTTLSEANEISAGYERFLLDRKDEWKIRKVSARFDRRNGSVTVDMPRGSTKKDLEALVQLMREELPETTGIERKVWARGVQGENDQSEGERGFTLTLEGRDSEFLRDWAMDLEKKLIQRKLAANVDLGNSANQDELRLEIDRQRMQELGVDPMVLLAFVNSGLTGQRVSRFREPGGYDTDVIAEFDEVSDMELKDLLEMQIWSMDSGFQRLGDLTDYRFTKGFEDIRRTNGVLTTSLTGERPENITMTDFMAGVRQIVSEQQLPRGFRWEMGGRFGDQREQQVELLLALLLGMVLVFLVMGLLFESVTLPVAVFGTVPFAMLGGLAGLFAVGHKFEVVVILGLMILGGVIVNNGIVLLDHVVRLRETGLTRHEAILQGVRDRLRPIVMTATTTIVGLLPMVFLGGDAQGGFDYKNMAIVVASGLLLGTFLTPFVVSLGYTLVDDFWMSMRRVMWRARAAKASQGETA